MFCKQDKYKDIKIQSITEILGCETMVK